MKRSLAVASMIASGASWGLAAVLSKKLVTTVDPVTLLSVQLSASVLFLWIMVALTCRKELSQLNAKVFTASLCGILEPGLSYAMGLFGLKLTGATPYSIISATEPLIIVFVAWAILGQRPGIRSLIGVAVALAGILLVSMKDSGHSEQNTLLGNALVVLGTFFAALYVVLTSRFVLKTPPVLLSALQQSTGLIFALGLFFLCHFIGEFVGETSSVEWYTWFLAAFSGIVQYAIAFWFYLYGLRTLPVSQAALYLSLIPVFGAAGAALFLGENIGAREIIGGILVVTAIRIGSSREEFIPEKT